MQKIAETFILILIPTIFIIYYIIKKRIIIQRNELYNEILDYLCISNAKSIPQKYDIMVTVKSQQALNNYDDIKYFKEHDCLKNVTEIITERKTLKNNIANFLKQNDFIERPQYNYVENQLNNIMLLTYGYKIRVIYVTSAGNIKGERLITITESRIKEINEHPEWLMTKSEYNKMLKTQTKEELDNKKHKFYEKVNSIIDFVNVSKDSLIVKSKIKKLDELIQQLFDKTINNIQKIKQTNSEEWAMIENFIDNIEMQVRKIIDDDKKISEYYVSDNFIKIKETCNLLNSSRKEFNEYINEKSQSISKLFGTRIVRNETQCEDTYNYIRPYKKTITPFTAEVSASVFSSAENNPINYIIKYFYPNKNQYKEQIQKLKILIEELETLKEAKIIIDDYKKDYEQYIKNVPSYVLENDENGFYSRLGLAVIDETILNIEYKFVYTSDGGMAQRSFTVPMNEENIIELINALENKLSIETITKEQRAMMTTKLRTSIKERDNFTCCQCGNSIYKEPNLLLEIDHIIPISKGGLTIKDNLQTLCWKCNRSKGAKLI